MKLTDSEKESVIRGGEWLEALATRMKNCPEEFVDIELEWQPDPINQYFHRDASMLNSAGYFVIKIQKVSHKVNNSE